MKVQLRDAKADLPVMQSMVAIRTLLELQHALSTKTGIDTELLEGQSTAKSKKTKFNIPITDVSIDKDYEANLRALYSLPTSYVRYTRRVGDEADMATDYNLEVEDKKWISGHPLLGGDKEAKRYLTSDAFEAIIDILERHTGYSKETVPQLHVQQLVVEKLYWEPQVAAKILPDVYAYWLKKREALKKPLCRRYWPQTPAVDNNPHLTFRPRDKEKYRLRKQHRKNDVDSFRKMQQLRKEFCRAHDLLCLLVERESLREAELEIKKEVFEQTLWDINNVKSGTNNKSSKAAPTRRATQFSHSLRFEELLKEADAPVAAIALDDPIWNNLTARKGIAPAGLTSGGSHAAQSQRVAHEAEARKAARRAQQAQQAQLALRKRVVEAEAPPPPPAPVSGLAQLNPPQRTLELIALQHMHPTLQGPRTACRPVWPHFMDSAPLRGGSWAAPASLSQYLDDLGGIDDDVYGLMRHSRIGNDGHNGGMLGAYKKPAEDQMDSVDEEKEWDMDLVKDLEVTRHRRTMRYRFRGRVGRGGRLIMDRIPVYTELPARSTDMHGTRSFAQFDEVFRNAAAEAAMANLERSRRQQHIYGGSFTQAASSVKYVQSSSINSYAPVNAPVAPATLPKIGSATSSAAAASMSTAAAAANTASAATAAKPVVQRGEIYIVPPTHPQERPNISAGLFQRQVEIYACSDSEDETLLLGVDSEQRRVQISRQKPNSATESGQTVHNFTVII